MFVIEDDERNVVDQKVIEVELQEKYEIKSMRLTFKEIAKYAVMDKNTHVLTVKGREIGLVYYRCGY